ncbi:MAG: hypothetical protein HUJ96_09675 [Marinilabiliaceae bacterium]|nr:hypothetical protein [Marinilabiliaceae bacterium]
MFNDTIAKRVTLYYASTSNALNQLFHTHSVVAYTRIISVGEQITGRQLELMETAAWLHDIGCPNARTKYGEALHIYQQKEGRLLAEEWLKDYPELTEEEKSWLIEVVGTHHQHKDAVEKGFIPLFEADIIANLGDGYYKRHEAARLRSNFFKTHTGIKILNALYADDIHPSSVFHF